MPQFDQACLLAYLEHLFEEIRKRLQMPLAELSDAVVVGVLICCQNTEGDVRVGSLLYSAGRGLADDVGVDEQFGHHHRVVGRPSFSISVLVGCMEIT